jgi:hypothetical protein
MQDDDSKKLTPLSSRAADKSSPVPLTAEQLARIDRLLPAQEMKPVERFVLTKDGIVAVTKYVPVRMVGMVSDGVPVIVRADELPPECQRPKYSRPWRTRRAFFYPKR